MIFVIGAGLAFRSEAISAINHFTPALNLLIGLGLLGGILAYLVWVTIRRRNVRFQGFRLELPGLGLSLGQILLGIIDQCAAAGVLYVLLPKHSTIDFFTFAATYVFGCILGVASNAPGGIGVFEATMLKAVPGVAQEPCWPRCCCFAPSIISRLSSLLSLFSARMRVSAAGGACARRCGAPRRRWTISARA